MMTPRGEERDAAFEIVDRVLDAHHLLARLALTIWISTSARKREYTPPKVFW